MSVAIFGVTRRLLFFLEAFFGAFLGAFFGRVMLVAMVMGALGPRSAWAAGNIYGISNFHTENPSLTLHQYVLGPVCLSLPATELDLDCNPAFLAKEKKHQLRFDVVGNDRVREVNEYRERLGAEDSLGIVNKILRQHEPLVARASVSAWYQRDWWAIGYVPFRGGFASTVRNPSYPTVAADIYKESELFAKAGLVAADDRDLELGLQLRFVNRQFFRNQFDLLDAVVDPRLLQVYSQRVAYLEPGISYSFDTAWGSAVSATLTNLAVYQSGFVTKELPVIDLGFRTAPPFFGRRLRTSTHFNNNPALPDLFSRLRWGAIYEFGEAAAVTIGLGKGSAAIGLNGNFESVVLGLGYKTEEVSPDQWQSIRVSTILFEAGLVF